jgi:hypothetical protein
MQRGNNVFIGYDLDGVLLPDFDYPGLENGDHAVSVPEMLAVRRRLRPLFQPIGCYTIITGRPKEDVEETSEWVREYLTVQPRILYIAADSKPLLSEDSAKYKAHCIKEARLHTFIESSEEIAELIVRELQVLRYSCYVATTQMMASKGLGIIHGPML